MRGLAIHLHWSDETTHEKETGSGVLPLPVSFSTRGS